MPKKAAPASAVGAAPAASNGVPNAKYSSMPKNISQGIGSKNPFRPQQKLFMICVI
jgi:hypothetical protein